MARPLSIQFGGAIYHVMARGNGRHLLFHADDDYQRMLSEAVKCLLDGLCSLHADTLKDVFAQFRAVEAC